MTHLLNERQAAPGRLSPLILLLLLIAGCGGPAGALYQNPDMGLELRHPETWVVADDTPGFVIISSRAGLNPDLPEDGALVTVFSGDTATLSSTDAETLLTRFINLSGILNRDSVTVTEAMRSFERDGLDVATTTVTGIDPVNDVDLSMQLMLVTDGRRLLVAIAATPSAERDTYGDSLADILDSLTFYDGAEGDG